MAASSGSAWLQTDFGLYHARYISRLPVPGLRKSSRIGPASIAFDPDGKNPAFFTEYPGRIDMLALTFQHKRAHGSWFGELTMRPHQPVQLPAGDVLPAFLNAAAASLLRADADAVAPGAIYHAYDRYRTTQLQLGMQHDWHPLAGIALSGQAEVVAKHAAGLPDPALRRYGRADIFGNGPINGVCTVTSIDAARQCSLEGYATASALAYRLRLDARRALPAAALTVHGWAQLTHDARGWSYDSQINEGRNNASLGVRLEYRQRYSAELVFAPVWGGAYNAQADRDQVSFALGMRY